MKKITLLAVFALSSILSFSQFIDADSMYFEDDTETAVENPRVRKYPARLWEITGNGLKQPSYLYGTMHVSKKLAFNLGDTFYRALNSVDVVALELAIDSWLSNIGRNMEHGSGNLYGFMEYNAKRYNSFYKTALNFEGFELDALLRELRSEDYMSNFLLYRQGYQSPDFSEKTYVDLYIHQVGKKLGKYCTGLEDFEISQRMVNRADWRDRTWPRDRDYGGYYYGYGESTTESAYREGDLDMIDSLEKKGADVHFLKWMLYERNKIMADNIENIVKTKRLFAAVGCAHLPGDSGVIEFLRRKGFTLTPVYDNIGDYAFKQKQKLESTNTAVSFKKYVSHNGELSFQLPGIPVDRSYGNVEDIFYADVANGAYYVIKKMPYYGVVKGLSQEKLLKKLDSALYENIPGDITARSKTTINGYPALDVSNRTKTGESQRHMYIIMPNDVWYVKLNAPGNYAEGKEAKEFFKSISIQSEKTNWNTYQPEAGGYELRWPARVVQNPLSFDTSTNLKGHKNLSFTDEKKNFYFLNTINLPYYGKDEDTFHMHQIAENYAYYNKGKVDKMSFKDLSGHPAMECSIRLKEKDMYLHLLLAGDGDQFYSVGVFSGDKKAPADFLDKFHFVPFKYKYLPVLKYDSLLGLAYKRTNWPLIEKNYQEFKEENEIAHKEIVYPEGNNYGYSYNSLGDYFKDSLMMDNKYAYPIVFPSGESVSISLFKGSKIAPTSRFKSAKEAGYYNGKEIDFKRYKKWSDSIEKVNDSAVLSQEKYTYHHNLKTQSIIDTVYAEGDFIIEERATVYPGTHWVNYYKTFYSDYESYSISTTYSKQRGMSAVVKDVIGSVKPKRKVNAVMDSAAFGNLMVQLLSSKDSLDLFRASDYLYHYSKIPSTFNDTLFSIMKVMDKNSLYGERYANAIEGKLILDNYQPLISYYMDKYRRGGDTSEIQAEMLGNLGKMKNKQALDSLMYWLLEETPLSPENSYNNQLFSGIIYSAYDSLKLWKNEYKKLLPLNRYTEYEDAIMSLGITLLDSNLIDSTVFAPIVADLALSFRDDLKRKLSKSANRGGGNWGGYGDYEYDYSENYSSYADPDNYEYGTIGNTLFSSGERYSPYMYQYAGVAATDAYSLNSHSINSIKNISNYKGSMYNYYGYEEGYSGANYASNTLYDKAKILVRFYNQNPDVPKRLQRVYRIQDDAEKMQFINLYLKHKIKLPDTMYRHYLTRSESQYGFVQMLKDRAMKDSIPKGFFDEKNMASSFASYRHFTNLDTVVYLGKKSVRFENEDGNMYFWKHRVKDKKGDRKEEKWQYSYVWIGEKDTLSVMKYPRYYHFNTTLNKKLSVKDMMNNEISALQYWKHPLWEPMVPEEEGWTVNTRRWFD